MTALPTLWSSGLQVAAEDEHVVGRARQGGVHNAPSARAASYARRARMRKRKEVGGIDRSAQCYRLIAVWVADMSSKSMTTCSFVVLMAAEQRNGARWATRLRLASKSSCC